METLKKIKTFSKNGYFSQKQCLINGISRYQLAALLDSGKVKKVKYGLYAFSDVLEDELFIPQIYNNNTVYSNETALYFTGFSDQVPFTYTITVPSGYHSKNLWTDFMVRQVPKEIFHKGIIELKSPYGNPIRVYCIERTLCELLHSRVDFYKERFIPAIQRYMREKSKDVYKVMEYAKMFNVEKKIRPYLEVLFEN